MNGALIARVVLSAMGLAIVSAGATVDAQESNATLRFLQGRLKIEEDFVGEQFVHNTRPFQHADQSSRVRDQIARLTKQIGRSRIDAKVLAFFTNEGLMKRRVYLALMKAGLITAKEFKNAVKTGNFEVSLLKQLAAILKYNALLKYECGVQRREFAQVSAHLKTAYSGSLSSKLQTTWIKLSPFRPSSTKATRLQWTRTGITAWASRKYPGKSKYSPIDLGELNGTYAWKGRFDRPKGHHFRKFSVTRPCTFSVSATKKQPLPKIWVTVAGKRESLGTKDRTLIKRELPSGDVLVEVEQKASHKDYDFLAQVRPLTSKELTSLRVGGRFVGTCREGRAKPYRMEVRITAVSTGRFEGMSSFPSYGGKGTLRGTVRGRQVNWTENRRSGNILSGTKYTAQFDGKKMKGVWRNGKRSGKFELSFTR